MKSERIKADTLLFFQEELISLKKELRVSGKPYLPLELQKFWGKYVFFTYVDLQRLVHPPSNKTEGFTFYQLRATELKV